tara:strand:+ start:8647 stop:9789 length:1143 start_codon:yes stop_codon:yes gene_type:complete
MSKKNNPNILKYFEKNNLMELLKAILEKDNFEEFNLSIGAIDVGYGNTKYTKGVNEQGELELDMFPSVSPLAPQQSMAGGLLGQRNVKIVDIEGTKYEVGPDAELTANNSGTVKNLNENYIFSEQYKALFLGALAYMNKEHYDYIVLGLPVNYLNNTEKLQEMFKGEHKVSEELTCNIDNVIVVPQPLGAFYDIAINQEKYFDLIEETNLVIDPGFLTYDFLTTYGLKPIESRSDALNGGMSRVLNTIAISISESIGKPYKDYASIDRSIRKPKKVKNPETGKFELTRIIKIAGKEYDLLPHIKNSTPTIENAINHMTNVVQTYDDLNNIILAGGADSIFEKKIREHIQRDILKAENAIYSNVRGFWLIGVLEAMKRLVK